MHIDQLATNAARRVIIPLDEVAAGLKLSESDFAPVVWNAGIYKDRRYGIPLDIHPLGFYANTAQLKKAGISDMPKDRAGFEAAVKALKDKAGVRNPFWVTATWPAHLMFTSLIAQFGGSIYDQEGAKATFNSDAGVAVAGVAAQLHRRRREPPERLERRPGGGVPPAARTPSPGTASG